MIYLSPHTSHGLKSLDVAVLKIFEDKCGKIILRFYGKTWMKLVDKGSFPVLLQQLCDQKSSSNSEAGFRGTGLWPFDPNTIRKSCNVQDHDDSSTQLGLCTSQEALVGDTSQKLLGMVIIANIHRVHWIILLDILPPYFQHHVRINKNMFILSQTNPL